jgi:hypothetical protein
MEISMKDRLQPKLPCHAPQQSTYLSSQSASPYARIGVTPVKRLLPTDILTGDLELSSSSEDSSDLEDHQPPKQSKPMMDPNEVVNLDGMKLRINLRLVRIEEAKLKAKPRQKSESSSTSCSMEEEDLPLHEDILSEVSFGSSCSSPAAKRHKFSSADDMTDNDDNGDKIKWLPYRAPPPDNQEDFIKREVEGTREYDM